MNAYLGMFTNDPDLASQLAQEAVHLTFLAVASGASIAFAIVGFLLRRDIKRADSDREAMAAAIEALEGKVEANDRRHGYEISDIKIEIAPLFTKAGLEQPKYPSR